MKGLIIPALEFLKNVDGKTAIVFGHDCDSISSASILFRVLNKLGKDVELKVSKFNFEVDEDTIKSLKNFENIVITDIGDTPERRINSIDKNVLIIDHHFPKNYKCTYVNPRIFKKNIYMPASYITWLIYRSFFNDSEVDWIAGIGTLGDFGMKENPLLYFSIKENYPKLVDNFECEDRILIEKSQLGKLTKAIDSCRIFGNLNGVIYAAKKLAEFKNYKEVLKDRKILEYYKMLKFEFNKELNNLKNNAIIIGDFIIYEIKSKYNLKSSFASFLPSIYKNKIIFIAQKNKEGFYEVSVRRGLKRKEDLNKLVEEIKRNTSAQGGGHPTAAGMRIDSLEELIKFIKNKKKGR